MKILTWNINGIRATKIPMKELLDSLDADIICIQETKVTRDQLDEPCAIVDGYNSYFSFSKARSGYSGVATFVKNKFTPIRAEEGLTGLRCDATKDDNIGCYGDQTNFSDEELHLLDNEGRTVITQHNIRDKSGQDGILTIINVYCPRADPEREDRKEYKLRFYELLQIRAEALLAEGSYVVVLGDVNTSHKRIDHCDPDDDKDFDAHKGRQWLNNFLYDPHNEVTEEVDLNVSLNSDHTISGHQFVDTFRYFYPDLPSAFTCWCTVTGARATNYGTRIDYIFADIKLMKESFIDCIIRPDIEGSDHCPVIATLSCEIVPSQRCPSLCSKYMPEFAGRQQKLSNFFTKCARPSSVSQLQRSNTNECQTNPPETLEPPTKKLKATKICKSSKQGSLLNFLSTGKREKHISNRTVSSEPVVPRDFHQQSSADKKTGDLDKCSTAQVQTWKTLLKGPPQAPLCKGHNEPCVLRTVKKDSLNKGRQFYVCNKPEGHKNNPEARCDHFEWIEKKKKTATQSLSNNIVPILK